MKQVLIIEHQTSQLQIMNESVSGGNGSNKRFLSGIFTEFDVMNRNERIYTPDKFLPAMNEMKQRMLPKAQGGLGVVYGELDHPEDFNISVKTASHAMRSINYMEQHNRVDGSIQLLSTENGKKAEAIIFEDGLPLFVSSRAAGVTTANSRVEIKKLFTYDIVGDPGFGSADVNPVHESLGYRSDKNFRIYEMKDETNINNLFMSTNQDQFVTNVMLSDYTKHINEQLASNYANLLESIKSGKVSPEEINRMDEYLQSLSETQKKMEGYLNYFQDVTQTIANNMAALENKTDDIIKHNDHIAKHTNGLANYSESLADNLNGVINYANKIGNELNNVVNYTSMIGEKLNQSINYSELISENVEKMIIHVDFIGENLDGTIQYCDLLGDNIKKSVKYMEYMATEVNTNEAYTKMIESQLDKHKIEIEKSSNHLNYLAEEVNKTVNYAGQIADKLNGNFINEKSGVKFPSLEEAGFIETTNKEEDQKVQTTETPVLENKQELTTTVSENEPDKKEEENKEEAQKEAQDDTQKVNENFTSENLDDSISALIDRVKNKKNEDVQQPHFLTFLDKNQVESYFAMTNEQQNVIKNFMHGKDYYSTNEVLALINESFRKQETFEDRLMKFMPGDVRDVWEKMDESAQKLTLSQANFYPQLETKGQIELFWKTRELSVPVLESSKVLVEHNPLITQEKFSDSQLNQIFERMKNL